MRGQGLSQEAAEAVYDVLLLAGAREHDRGSFVHHQTKGYETEWRFMGFFGFGGKFWRNVGHRPDGTWGEVWYINGYPENMTDALEVLETSINQTLEELRKGFQDD